jgi:tRNA 2-thiouridine synthesizing protein A
VPCLVDARGLRCPLPLVKAREALASLAASDTLVVLATDPEAPIDLAALASDVSRPFGSVAVDGGWRLELGPALTAQE